MSDRDRSFQRPKKEENRQEKLFYAVIWFCLFRRIKILSTEFALPFFYKLSIEFTWHLMRQPQKHIKHRENPSLKKQQSKFSGNATKLSFLTSFSIFHKSTLVSADNDSLWSKNEAKIAFIWKCFKVETGNLIIDLKFVLFY